MALSLHNLLQPSSKAPSQSTITFSQAMEYWIAGGGNPQAAQMAASVADSSSGLNPNATRTNADGSQSVGLWMIPQTANSKGSTDPTANARLAVQLSNNGTDWSQWCVAWSDNNCGANGGVYLSSGSQALDVLGSQAVATTYNVVGSQYSVAGSAPAGDGVGASSATSSAAPTTQSTSSSSSGLLIVVVLVGIALAYLYFRRREQQAVQAI